MSKSINTQFEYLGLVDRAHYNYRDKNVNVMNNITYMFDRSLIMFKYHNLPKTIPFREMERQLQTIGYCFITKDNDNMYSFTGGLGGIPDEYYRPTEIVIDNPYLKFNKILRINEDGVLIRNDSNCIGLTPIYAKYCTQLSETEITLMLALVNKRIQSFITASDDNTRKSAEEFMKHIYEGDLSVIGTSQLFDSFNTHDNNSKSDKTLSEIYEIIKYIKGDLFNEIGLASYNTAKKERVSNAELELNSDNLYPLVDDMLANRREGIEKVNEMYGTNITVELNSSWDYRVLNGMGVHNTKDEITIDDVNRTDKSIQNNKEENETMETNENTIKESETK